MAEVIGADHNTHRAGHEEIGPACPISCLGVRTVGDLLLLLTKTARVLDSHEQPGVPMADGPHECSGVTVACPVECLGLSAHVLNALRADRGRAQTVGDLLDLLRSGELREVRNVGPRRVGEVYTALVAAGFTVPRPLP